MKSPLVAGAFIAIVLACSVDHATDEIACDTQADCNGGRTCTNGYCVVGGTTNPNCPSQCSTCDVAMKTCTTSGNSVTCPSGYSCTISCGNNQCKDVDCSNATACTIQCTGSNSCDSIKCGAGRCNVTCSGSGSCMDIDCRDSCACDVSCAGAQSCNQARCPGQCTSGKGCASTGPSCSSC